MVNFYRLLVAISLILILVSNQEAQARPHVKKTNVAQMLNSAKSLLDFEDTIAVLEAGAQASRMRPLMRLMGDCQFGSEFDRKNCYNFGIIPLFTKDQLKVRPRRAARILKRACTAALTWSGEADCFQWGLLAIKGDRIFNRIRNCNFLFNSTKQQKAQCYRNALRNL